MTTDTFSPPTLDGWVGRINAGEASFADLRAGAGNEHNDTSTGLAMIVGTNPSSEWDDLRRLILLFGLSSIAGRLISAASLTVRTVGAPIEGIAGQEVVVVTASPASQAALADADFAIANFGMGSVLSDATALADIAPAGDVTFTFNAAGIAYLQTVVDGGGVAELGIVFVSDQEGTDPESPAPNNLNAQVSFESADTGLANPPVLSVTHEVKPDPEAPALEAPPSCVALWEIDPN